MACKVKKYLLSGSADKKLSLFAHNLSSPVQFIQSIMSSIQSKRRRQTNKSEVKTTHIQESK